MSDAVVKGIAGSYVVTWEQDAVTIRVDKLREDSHYTVKGEGLVTHLGNHVHQARYDLTATRSRKDFANQCTERSPVPDWVSFVEEASLLVLERFREGEPVIDFTDFEPAEESQYAIYPLLLHKEPNLLFGPAGSGKSFMAAFIAALMSHGLEKNQGMNIIPGRVLYLDYETSPDEIYKRLRSIRNGLNIEEPVSVQYQFMTAPLTVEIEKIQRTIIEEDIELVIVDSVGYACGGEPELPSNAIHYYNALRSLKVTSLSLAHIAKDLKANTPFGSMFWQAGGRSVWEVVRAQESEASRFHVGLIHKKINNGALKSPMSFELDFNPDTITFTRQEISMVPDAMSKLPLSDRMYTALQLHGPMTPAVLAEELEAKVNSITRALSRNTKFTVVQGGDNHGKWTLAPSNGLTEPLMAEPALVVDKVEAEPQASTYNMGAWAKAHEGQI